MSQFYAQSGRVMAHTESATNSREGSVSLGTYDFTIGHWERTEDGGYDATSNGNFDGDPIRATLPSLQAVVDAFAEGLDRER